MALMDWDVVPTLSISSIALASISVLWLILRLNQVLKQPVDDLVKVLGLEVPVAPRLTILDITPSKVSIHWTPSDQRNAVSKYAVRLNGILLNEISETAITITGLSADTFYTIRVTAINSANFQAPSNGVRVKTLHEGLPNGQADAVGRDNVTNTSNNDAIRIVPLKVPQEALLTPPSIAPPMAREHSGSITQSKRGSASKQVPLSSPDELDNTESPSDHSTRETVEQLGQKLDSIRRELLELESQDKEEEEEFQNTRHSLSERREELRQQLKERDDESKELKKNSTLLERAQATAMSKTAAQDRILQQKLGERKKMQENIERFGREQHEFRTEAANLLQLKEDLLEDTQNKIQEIKDSQEEDLTATKALEDSIRERGFQVKDLEEEKKGLQEEVEDGDAADWQRKMEAEERDWRIRCNELTMQYQAAWVAYNQTVVLFQQASQRVDYSIGRRGSQPTFSPPQYSAEAPVFQPETQPHQHLVGSRRNFGSPDTRPISFPYRAGTGPYAPVIPPPASLPHHTKQNTTESPQKASLKLSATDMERLTGGALTSPTADGLLPSGLLGDDIDEHPTRFSNRHLRSSDEMLEARPSSTTSRPLSMNFGRAPPTSGLLPGLGSIPGLGTTDSFEAPAQPTSPVSIHSQSPSLVSSPHGSLSHLPHRFSDGPMDSDRRSVRSASGSSRIFPGRRIGDFWSRQRGKTTSNDGPALGTLKSSQTQSLPRADGEGEEAAPPTTSPRKYPNPSSLFGISGAVRGKKPVLGKSGEESDTTSLHSLDQRRNHFSVFSSRVSPWSSTSLQERPPSPRQGSTYSFENTLPRPTAEAQPFGWNIDRSSRRNSINNGPPPTNPWSSSRRQSLLPEESADLELDEHELLRKDQITPPQAPIGTKPIKTRSKTSSSGQPDSVPRDFMSFFSREKKTSDKGSEKSGSKTKKMAGDKPSINSLATSSVTTEDQNSTRDGSNRDDSSFTGGSYWSRDFHGSEANTDSADEATDSYAADGNVFNSPLDLPETPSTPVTPSGTETPSGKGSLMRKITRKTSSSGRFSLKGARFSRSKQTPGGEDTPTSTIAEGTPSLGPEELESSLDSIGPGHAQATAGSDDEMDKEKEKQKEKEKEKRRQKRSSTGFSISSFKKRKDRDNGKNNTPSKERDGDKENNTSKGKSKDDDVPSISEASLTSEAGEPGDEDDV